MLRASLEGCFSPPAIRATSPQVGRRVLRGSLEGCYSPPALRAASPQVGRRFLRASLEGCYSPPALRAASPHVGRRVQVLTPHPRFARPPHMWGGEFRFLLPTRASRGLPTSGE